MKRFNNFFKIHDYILSLHFQVFPRCVFFSLKLPLVPFGLSLAGDVSHEESYQKVQDRNQSVGVKSLIQSGPAT